MVVCGCEFGVLWVVFFGELWFYSGWVFFSRAEKNQKAKGRVEKRTVGACDRGGAGRRNSLRSDIRRPDRPAVAALPAILQCAQPCGYGGGVWMVVLESRVFWRIAACRFKVVGVWWDVWVGLWVYGLWFDLWWM